VVGQLQDGGLRRGSPKYKASRRVRVVMDVQAALPNQDADRR